MHRFILLIALVMLTGCSHHASPELRRMLRDYFATADAPFDSDPDQQKWKLYAMNNALYAKGDELRRAWPKDWHESQQDNIFEMAQKFRDAFLDWGDTSQPSEKAKSDLAEAYKKLRSAHAELDDEMRE